MKILLSLFLSGFCMASAQAITGQDAVIVVGPKSPYGTLAALIEAGRSTSVTLLCGAGSGTPGCDGFARSAGIKVNTVSYKATGSVARDVWGKTLDFGVLTSDDSKTFVEQGKLRILK